MKAISARSAALVGDSAKRAGHGLVLSIGPMRVSAGQRLLALALRVGVVPVISRLPVEACPFAAPTLVIGQVVSEIAPMPVSSSWPVTSAPRDTSTAATLPAMTSSTTMMTTVCNAIP